MGRRRPAGRRRPKRDWASPLIRRYRASRLLPGHATNGAVCRKDNRAVVRLPAVAALSRPKANAGVLQLLGSTRELVLQPNSPPACTGVAMTSCLTDDRGSAAQHPSSMIWTYSSPLNLPSPSRRHHTPGFSKVGAERQLRLWSFLRAMQWALLLRSWEYRVVDLLVRGSSKRVSDAERLDHEIWCGAGAAGSRAAIELTAPFG